MRFSSEEDKELQHDIAEKLQRVQWHGHYFTACCPYHKETHPSFFVYPDFFKCSSCYEMGSLNKLWKFVSGEPDAEQDIVHDYVPFNSWLRKHKTWTKVASVAYNNGKDFPPLMSYLKKRKLGDWFKVGFFGWIDGWFTFPVFDEYGEMVDLVVRAHPDKKTELRYAIRPRERVDDFHLYCPDWELVEQSDTVYVPFGIMDVWSVRACGLPAVTGMTGQDYKPYLFDKIRKRIIILPDANELTGARKLQRALGWRGEIKMLDYPEGTKDSNGVHCMYGIETLKSLILN